MQNELTVFKQQEVLGKGFKIYGTIDNPLFLAKDISEWIDHNKPHEMISNVDECEKLKAIISLSGQKRDVWFVTEDGLYEILMQSRKPIAKQFKKKVKEILKQIRQTGGYIPVKQEDDDSTIMAKALLIADKTLINKDKIIAMLQPKAEKYDEFINADNVQTMLEISKVLQIGRNTLMRFLRVKKIFMSNNLPYAKYCNSELFKTREFTIHRKHGDDINICQTLATAKGLSWISDIIKEEMGGLLYKESTGQIRLNMM